MEAAGAPSAAPDVHVGDIWKFRTLDGFTNETQFDATHRVVEINNREIVIELHNLSKDKTALRYFTREWNAVDTDEGDAVIRDPNLPARLQSLVNAGDPVADV